MQAAFIAKPARVSRHGLALCYGPVGVSMRWWHRVFICAALLPTCNSLEPAPLAPLEPLPFGPARFNTLAARRGVDVLWRADEDGDLIPDAGEVEILALVDHRERWLLNGRTTAAFARLLAELRRADAEPAPTEERAREVRHRLDYIANTAVVTDARSMQPYERALLRQLVRAAEAVDDLHALQSGTSNPRAMLLSVEEASLLNRDWRLPCVPDGAGGCLGTPSTTGFYPLWLQQDLSFCADLTARADGVNLLAPLTIVVEERHDLAAVGLAQAYPDAVSEVVSALVASAEIVEDEAVGSPFATFLRNRAARIETDHWFDPLTGEASMEASGGRWYIELSAQSSPVDPCRRKSGVSMWLGRVTDARSTERSTIAWALSEASPSFAELWTEPERQQLRFRPLQSVTLLDTVVVSGAARGSQTATYGRSVSSSRRGLAYVMPNQWTTGEADVMEAQAAAVFFGGRTDGSPYDDVTQTIRIILHEASHVAIPVPGSGARGAPDVPDREELLAEAGACFLVAHAPISSPLQHAVLRMIIIGQLQAAATASPRGARAASSRLFLDWLLRRGAVRWNAARVDGDTGLAGSVELDYDALPRVCGALLRMATGTDAEQYAGDVVAADVVAMASALRDRFDAIGMAGSVFAPLPRE